MGTFVIIITIIVLVWIALIAIVFADRNGNTATIIPINQRKKNNNISYAHIKGKCRRNFKITIADGNDNE